ncbi:MAG TPA: hypothetical protein PLB74_02750 [Candidatus Paceibacterota bacterium]|nr:hypothetical protein [Candidatus Paceibacterota bacterium]
MEITVITLAMLVKINNGKYYSITPKLDTCEDILNLIIEKEGKINISNKEIEFIDFKNEKVFYKD